MKTKIVVVKKKAGENALSDPLIHVACCAVIGTVLAGNALLGLFVPAVFAVGCAFIVTEVTS